MAARPAWAAVRSVARQRFRGRWIASIGLVVLAGVSAALPMAVWSASRRASVAHQHFAGQARPADANLVVCPPGLVLDGPEGPLPCYTHDPARELEVIRADPHVRGVARYAYRGVDVGPSADVGALRSFEVGAVALEDPAPEPTILGDPIVLSGRLARPGATDEVVATESSASSLRLDAGDRMWMRLSGTDAALSPVTITGVVRTPDGLLPLDHRPGGPALLAGPEFLARQRAEVPTEFGGVAVWLDDGDLDGMVRRVRAQLDQIVDGSPMLAPDDVATIEQATDFESRAGTAVSAVAAVVALFFVGQAVSRQARSELVDGPTLATLGLTRRDQLAIAVLRWTPVAVGAGVLALAVAVAASVLGPLGVARRGVWERTIQFDGPVLAIGACATVAVVLAVGSVGSARPSRRHDSGAAAPVPVGSRSPSIHTGLGLAWHGLRRGATLPLVSAVVASAVALGALVTAAGASATLRVVTDDPARFGAPWDVGISSGPGDPTDLAEIDGIAHAATIGGTDVAIGDEPTAWVQAFFPIEGLRVTRPVMVDGRAPAGDREIALGARTSRKAGVEIGDRVEILASGRDSRVHFEVVGTTMVADGVEPNVGHGAIVTPQGMARIEPATEENAPVGIGLTSGPGHDRTLAELRDRFPSLEAPFPVPPSLVNAERVARLPLLLALGGAALAAVTFAHALAVSVRRNRRELAVCRVLGFTRGQVRSAVATQATVLAAAALALGLPLGMIGARWGWGALAQAFGVATEPRVPVAVAAGCVIGMALLAGLTALPAAWAATRKQTSAVLRSE